MDWDDASWTAAVLLIVVALINLDVVLVKKKRSVKAFGTSGSRAARGKADRTKETK